MKDDELLVELGPIFAEILDCDPERISLTATAEEIDEWDSLTHTMLVAAIERHFGLRFSTSEIQGFADVAGICAGIRSRLAA